jgi:RimJ/RimL family protein N-acetyltransferase
MSKNIYFYVCETNSVIERIYDLDKRYHCHLWRPSLFEVVPKECSLMPFTAWWFMHYFHIFKNRDYSMLLIYKQSQLVSRLVVHPGYLRFPFLAKDDLFMSDSFTDPAHRGRHLVTFAMQYYLLNDNKLGRKYWGIVPDDNLASIRTVEKAGFKRVAEGKRVKRFRLHILGKYEPSFY